MNLRDLYEKATGGEWELETVPTSIGSCHKIGPFPSNMVRGGTHACIYADGVRVGEIGNKIGNELRTNAALIVALHNCFPELWRVVEVAEKECAGRCVCDEAYKSRGMTDPGCGYCDMDELRAALARLKEKEG